MSYFMAVRAANTSDELSMLALIHALIALSLVPVLL
jgi:hypothetical protein